MSNPNFNPEQSTNTIYRDNDFTRCLTDDLDSMDALIAGKADSDHNHDGSYAALNHSHSDYSAATHNHDDLYAAKTHETNTTVHVTSEEKAAWNSKAAANHNHDSVYADIDHVHTDFAASSHTHNTATTTAAGFLSAADKSKLDGIAAGATAYVHPETHPASMITGLPTIPTSLPANGGNADTVDNCHASDFASATHNHDSNYAPISHNHNGTYAAASHTHTDYAATSHSHSTATTTAAGFMSGTDKTKLNGIAANANNYSHPASHPASMITETDSLKVMTAAERTKLDGIAENANNYVHPSTHAASMITGLASVATSGSYNDLSNKPSIPAAYSHPSTHPASMITGLSTVATSGSYADLANKPSTFTPAAHTHAQSEITGLETALAGKASTSHTEHAGEIISNKASGAGITLQTSYGKTRIHKNSNANSDYGTIISDYDTDGKRDYLQIRRSAPSTERKLYFMSEATDGSMTQYKIYGEHNKPGILWSGVVYPGAESVVTLSKTLSECRGGILLLWSDYDADTSTANNNDFATTIIPRMSPTGGNWNGESFYCEVPRYIGSDTNDVTTESRIIKRVKVYNNKIEGYIENSRDVRSDVVLRAIYEY